VTEAEVIHVRPWHRILGIKIGVPQGFCGIMTFTRGRAVVFEPGYRRIYPRVSGFFQLIHVNVGDQVTAVQVSAPSADTWQVSLEVEVRWRVVDPKRIITANQPTDRVQAACRQALRDLIQTTTHDKLVGGEVQPLDSRYIGGKLRQQLNEQAIPGIKIDSVALIRRIPNEQRRALLQQAQIEATRYRTALMVETEQNEFTKARYAQRADVLDSEQAITLKEEQYRLDRSMVQQRGSVNLAKVAVEEDRHVQQKARQAIETDNLRRAQELEYQRIRDTLKYRAEVLNGITAALTTVATTQGALATLDQATIGAMAALTQAVTKDMDITPDGDAILGYENKKTEATDSVKGSNGRVPADDGYFSKRIHS
jgi:hypothetical protein